MCSVQGGVDLVKDVAGLVVSPLTFVTNKVAESRAVLMDEDSSSSDDEEAPKQHQIPLARTTQPQTLTFIAPADAVPGKPVCVQGPHGPLRIPLPADVQPNKECSIRLGPPDQYTVKVPEGAGPGTPIQFKGTQGESLHTACPAGLKAGDEFKVSPPVLLIQVPKGVKPGQQVSYDTPFGQRLYTIVPRGMSEGHYFAALFEVPKASGGYGPAAPVQAPAAATMEGPGPAASATSPQSAEVAGRLAALEAGKKEAIEKEDFLLADQLKKDIKALQSQNGRDVKLADLQAQKKKAIADEDFVGAQTLKEQIEELQRGAA